MGRSVPASTRRVALPLPYHSGAERRRGVVEAVGCKVDHRPRHAFGEAPRNPRAVPVQPLCDVWIGRGGREGKADGRGDRAVRGSGGIAVDGAVARVRVGECGVQGGSAGRHVGEVVEGQARRHHGADSLHRNDLRQGDCGLGEVDGGECAGGSGSECFVRIVHECSSGCGGGGRDVDGRFGSSTGQRPFHRHPLSPAGCFESEPGQRRPVGQRRIVGSAGLLPQPDLPGGLHGWSPAARDRRPVGRYVSRAREVRA